jgi:hypothetical protein
MGDQAPGAVGTMARGTDPHAEHQSSIPIWVQYFFHYVFRPLISNYNFAKDFSTIYFQNTHIILSTFEVRIRVWVSVMRC